MADLEISVTEEIDATPEQVWEVVRDFNARPNWHPAVADSRIEEDLNPAQVGVVRNFTLNDGGKIRERLLALSDCDRYCTYSILSSPMPVSNYVATLRLSPAADGSRCLAEWSCSCDCPEEESEGLVELIGTGVFWTGLQALDERFSG